MEVFVSHLIGHDLVSTIIAIQLLVILGQQNVIQRLIRKPDDH